LGICINAQSQNTQKDSISFYQAIKLIEKEKKISFAFNHKLFLNKKVIQFNPKDPIEDIIPLLIDNKEFLIEKSDGTYLIVPKNKSVSENIAIVGVVIDKTTGETLPNAIVYVKATGKNTVTNKDGKFSFLGIASDTTLLEVRYLGFESKTFKINEFSNPSNIELTLVNKPSVLKEVTVLDQKEKVFEISTQSSKVSIDIDEFNMLSNFGEPDVFRAIQLLPGVNGTEETSASLIIRGGLPEHNLVLFDGFTVYQLDHFFGTFSAFNSNVIKDVQIYKSGYDAKYGSRISGIVDITAKTGNTYKPTVNLGINLISANAVVEIPFSKKISFLLAGRRSYTDVIQTTLYKKLFNNVKENDPNAITQSGEDVSFLNPEFYFFDINSKLTYRINESNLLSLSFYHGKDNLFIDDSYSESSSFPVDYNYEYSSQEKTDWGNTGISLRFAKQWNKKLFTELYVSGSNFFRNSILDNSYKYEYDTINENYNSTFTSNNLVDESSLKIDSEYKINDVNSINLGLYSIKNQINYLYFYDDQPELADLDLEENGSIGGLFSQYNYSNGKTSVKLGFRLTSSSVAFYNPYFEPRASFSYQLNSKLNIKASYSKNYQFVVNTVITDPTSTTTTFWQLANDIDIPVLSANHYTTGLTFSKNNFVIDLEGYFKQINGLTLYSYNSDTDELFSLGSGKSFGLEVLIKKQIKTYTGWLAYTFSKSENSFNNINNGNYFAADYDQRHEIKIVNMLTVGKWDFSATWIYGSGKPYTPIPTGSYAVDSISSTIFYPSLDLNSKNSLRLPAYHRLDASVSYYTSIGTVNTTFGINLLNIYNRTNIKGYRISPSLEGDIIDYSEVKAIKLLNFTPSIFINISF